MKGKKISSYIAQFSTTRAVIYLIIIYCVGLALSYFEATQALFQFLIPINILFSLGVLFLFHEGDFKKIILPFFVIAFLSFLVEGIGVNTGKIFGNYIYLTALGVKVWNTPIMIGVNWFLLIYCTQVLAQRWTRNPFILASIASAFMVMYDWVLEPVAINFNFWNWYGNPIPLQNYLAWFVLAWLFHIFLFKIKFQAKNRLAVAIFFIQFVFFILLHFIHHIPFWH